MKSISFFPVLCLCAVAFSSCKDRFNESGAEGRAISFFATVGFPSVLTKTQYSGAHRFYGVYPSSYVEFTTNLNGVRGPAYAWLGSSSRSSG